MAEKRQEILPLKKLRNIGIIAHIDAGKTTTTERILYYTGKTYKIGNIDEGDTQMDWMEQEKERGITIMSAATTTFWSPASDTALHQDKHRINIIDTPGHVDFTAEVERSLRVLDGGVVILDASSGVQSQTETVWRQADKYNVPRIAMVNKMDSLGADFHDTIEDVHQKLGANTAVMALPIGVEDSFKGMYLLLEQKAIIWNPEDDTGTEYEVTDEVPENLDQDKIKKYRSQLIEQIVERDDQLMEKYLNGTEPDISGLKKVLRKATIANDLVPVFPGSALRSKGVQPLLDAIIDFLPSPLDVPPVKGVKPGTEKEIIRQADTEGPVTALAFKIQTDPHVGRLTYLRVYSGTIESGSYIYNSSKGNKERLGRLLLMHANSREQIDTARAGEIVAAVGLSDSSTGDTLCDPEQPVILETISFPDPVISLAIEPKTKSDQEKLGSALRRLSDEDPTFQIKSDPDTGQTLISGMGELHLEILVDRLKREFSIEANTGQPQVAYKETITSPAEGEGKYIRQSGGRGQYGHCLIRIKPLPRGEGRKFENKITGGAIPREFINPVEKGVTEAEDNGILAGYPLTDLQVELYDGSYHDVDSSEVAFKIAGSEALQSAVRSAKPVLLEPIMKMEVTTPQEFMGDVIGDLSSRRAHILSNVQRGNARVITCLIPLSEMSRYTTSLRSLTKGRAHHYMEPHSYDIVPDNITQQLIDSQTGDSGKK